MEFDELDELRTALARAGPFHRALFVLYTFLGAVGAICGGYLLLHETSHWLAWTIAIAIVEPIGLACALTLVVLIAPDSILAGFFLGAVRRATVALVLLAGALFLFLAFIAAYAAWFFASSS